MSEQATETTEPELTTTLAVDAIAWGRAPAYSPKGRPNLRVLCADGFSVSVQASSWHYAEDSGADGAGPYWRELDAEPIYPFITFEVGYPTDEPPTTWDEYEGGGIWARVPRNLIEALLDDHGGAVGWTRTETNEPA